jgi:hypothetical protein
MCAGHQQEFRINVWAVIVVLLCDRQCLQEFPPSLFFHDFWKIRVRAFGIKSAWLKDDGAAATFSRSVRGVLSGTYHDKRIGRAGAVAWPPRSPDLSRLVFYL